MSKKSIIVFIPILIIGIILISVGYYLTTLRATSGYVVSNNGSYIAIFGGIIVGLDIIAAIVTLTRSRQLYIISKKVFIFILIVGIIIISVGIYLTILEISLAVNTTTSLIVLIIGAVIVGLDFIGFIRSKSKE